MFRTILGDRKRSLARVNFDAVVPCTREEANTWIVLHVAVASSATSFQVSSAIV